MLKPIPPKLITLSPYIIPGLPQDRKAATQDIIIDIVCNAYDIVFPVLCKRNRQRKFVEARQIIMYLLCQYTSMPLKKIADLFGGYDHSTVIHSRQQISNLLCTDPDLANRVARIRMKLQAHGKTAEIVVP